MPEAPNIRILIADDHRMFREGLRRLLQTEAGFEIVGEATDGEETLEMTSRLRPDVLLLDVAMPRLSGLEVLRQLPDLTAVHVLLLTAAIDKEEILQALQSGARGVVMKDFGAEVLVRAIRAIVRGEFWVERSTMADWMDQLRTAQSRQTKLHLTSRELEIVAEISAGATNREIATRFGISEETVKRHLSNVFDKVGVSNRLELALYAISHKIVAAR